MDIQDIKTGDTLLVKGDTWLSRIIVKVMKHWAKKKGYPTEPVYSHAGRFIWIEGKLYVFESVENGYNPRLFERHYDLVESDLCVMRRRLPLSEEERIQTTHFCLHLDTISISYQFWNFIQWLLLVYLGINTFTKDTDKFEYCYESEMKARKNLNPDHYGFVNQTDVFELLYDENYEVIYKSR